MYPGRLQRAPLEAFPASPLVALISVAIIATLSRDHSMAQITYRPARFHRLYVSLSSVPQAVPVVPASRPFMCTRTTITLLLRWALRIQENSSAGTEI